MASFEWVQNTDTWCYISLKELLHDFGKEVSQNCCLKFFEIYSNSFDFMQKYVILCTEWERMIDDYEYILFHPVSYILQYTIATLCLVSYLSETMLN